MNDKGVCETAPGKPGLLIIDKFVRRTALATLGLLMTTLYLEQPRYTRSAKYSYKTLGLFVLRKYYYILRNELVSTNMFRFYLRFKSLQAKYAVYIYRESSVLIFPTTV